MAHKRHGTEGYSRPACALGRGQPQGGPLSTALGRIAPGGSAGLRGPADIDREDLPIPGLERESGGNETYGRRLVSTLVASPSPVRETWTSDGAIAMVWLPRRIVI